MSCSFEAILGQWLVRTGVTPQEPVAIDGQTLRAVAASAVPGSHLVSVYAHASAAVVAQIMVPNKGHEQPALDRVLTQIPLAGRLVTFDALPTLRDVCQVLDEAGALFVAPVRANQPTLLAEIQEIFAPWPLETGDPPAWLQAEGAQSGGSWQSLTLTAPKPSHGRREWRRIGVWTDPRWATSLGLSSDNGQPWPMVRQLIRIERRRTHLRHHHVIKETQEIVYFLRNQPAPARRTLTEIRRHWQIENCLHRQRDVLFDQDHSTVRVGAAAHIVAALRNLALTIFHRHHIPNAAAARRTWAGRPHLAVALVLAL